MLVWLRTPGSYVSEIFHEKKMRKLNRDLNSSDEEFLDEMAEEHNKLRSVHLAPPLMKNRNMSLQAKALAIQLAAEANLRHSDKASRPDQGENLAMGCTSSGPGITAKDAAKEW